MEIRQLLAVSGVLLLMGVALWWLRSKGLAQYGMRPSSGARRRTLESMERLPLGPQHSLHLVRLAGRNHNSIIFHAIDMNDPVGRRIVEFVGKGR